MNTLAIIQARMGSTRFPNKVMKPIQGTPLIEILIDRLRKSNRISQLVLATSTDQKNDPLSQHIAAMGVAVYRGSEQDVLDRYYQAAKQHGADLVVRITGDCPLVDPELVDELISKLELADADYASNIDPPTFPDGMDVEVLRFSALERAWRAAVDAQDREHVTPYIRREDGFKRVAIKHEDDLSKERWTVDEPADFDVIEAIFQHFFPNRNFGWLEVVELTKTRPGLFRVNQHLVRNEGAQMGTGQKLWKRAKRVIPGGNMLLSKRAEMFLPEQWPAYFSRAKGCKVWDLDNKEYIDMSFMGIGTNTLGYGHPEVDEAVHKTVSAGNMSTLNCPEEVYLAEKLVELHPWAEMVRFARSGGEAVAVAIRIARAASGREKVAICGYHGWHDWYLAANLGDEKNLAGHLLPGLEPNGVPTSLRGSVLPFNYNRFDELISLVERHDVGVIVMEVSRNMGPADGFLQKVRQLASERSIVLIFDECTSGFRQTFGGLHKQFGVEPDVATFGKALGNGYAITAVIGKRAVMEAAQTTFISSTFWTERIGPSAALKTLEVMERMHSWDAITAIGLDIQERWRALAARHGLSIATSGLPALAAFTFNYPDALAYKTIVTQEMLARGYLAGTSVYTCIEHSREIVEPFFAALDPVFGLIKECADGRDVNSILKGPVCHAGFKRLN